MGESQEETAGYPTQTQSFLKRFGVTTMPRGSHFLRMEGRGVGPGQGLEGDKDTEKSSGSPVHPTPPQPYHPPSRRVAVSSP